MPENETAGANENGSTRKETPGEILPSIDDKHLAGITRSVLQFFAPILQKHVLPYLLTVVAGFAGFGIRGVAEKKEQGPKPEAPTYSTLPTLKQESDFAAIAASKGSPAIIESLDYVCHLDRGKAPANGKWGGPSSGLHARVHITYSYRGLVDGELSDERYQTTQGNLDGFYASAPITTEKEPPSPKLLWVSLLFPLKKGEIKSLVTGVDYDYLIPLKAYQEMGTVDVAPDQYFLHYPNKEDYIREVRMTIESSTLLLSNGLFVYRQDANSPTMPTAVPNQAPCASAYCGDAWRQIVTAERLYIPPGADFGVRVNWKAQ